MTVISRLRDAGVEVYTREDWGTPVPLAYATRLRTHPMPPGPAKCHFLHITVTDDTDLPIDGKAAMRKVESYGYSVPAMVSYHDCVTNEGRYFEGQNYGAKGTHTQNDKNIPGFPKDLNLYGYALAILQNVQDEVTDRQVEVIAMVYAARELEGLVVRGAPIYPHRMFSSKSCPGDKAVARMDEIARLKNYYVRNGLPTQEEEMKPEDWDKIRQIVREEVDASNDALLAEKVEVTTPEGGTRTISVKQLLRETWQRVAKHI
jgi:hypothetical protein